MSAGHPNPYVRLWRDLPWPPPNVDEEKSRVIRAKVWVLDEIKAIARSQLGSGGNRIRSITDRCTKDIQNLQFTSDDLANRVLKITDDCYRNSLWCMRGHLEGIRVPWEQLWLPCDAYAIKRHEQTDSGWSGEVEYYIKLCLNPGKTALMLVSLHL